MKTKERVLRAKKNRMQGFIHAVQVTAIEVDFDLSWKIVEKSNIDIDLFESVCRKSDKYTDILDDIMETLSYRKEKAHG